MEKKEQNNKAMQPLNEAELEEVNGGISAPRPEMKERKSENVDNKRYCHICGAKLSAHNMEAHFYEVHGIRSTNP